MLGRFRGFFFCLLAVLLPAAAAQAQLAVSGVRVGENAGVTRFVLDVSQELAFGVFVLSDPYRVVIDLPDVEWRIDAAAGTRKRGLVEGFRYGQFQPGTSRVVLDLGRPAEVQKAFLIPPQDGAGHRLVVDLRPVDRESFLEAVRRSAPAPTAPVPTPAAAPLLMKPATPDGRKTIVIDPGHGGVDPGAIGVSGIHEKEITLAIATELRRRLEATGRYRVVVTRDSDVFLRLDERVRVAREALADLFISIHADSIGDREVRGASVYTLSQTASDKEAEDLAAKENKSDIIAGIDLAGESDEVTTILIDLARRETMNHSASFAHLLVRELGERVLVLRNGHRFAGFRVLKAPDIPSVLIELGYLSSTRDEQFLRSAGGRAKLSEAIAAAVERYFSTVRS